MRLLDRANVRLQGIHIGSREISGCPVGLQRAGSVEGPAGLAVLIEVVRVAAIEEQALSESRMAGTENGFTDGPCQAVVKQRPVPPDAPEGRRVGTVLTDKVAGHMSSLGIIEVEDPGDVHPAVLLPLDIDG